MQAIFFPTIDFELGALQVPLTMGETFGEVSGLRRQTGSEPRPALIWEPEIAIWPRWS